ncbi:hypothetical protein GALMADRAFT_149222 [Galerina marginata CBS 339.88]|uniref:Uncharacterized protein n=1 Tax=Galerina marginata (strain CBS 339.88) TaxID=685588 RepID=A0A067S243_GALM3|nr:hypothetical protein GALMADRAFT_149222 [Galerina marginata CBS 339.88]
MDPVWYFTSQALLDYMPTAVPIHKPLDPAYIGAKIEAFAVAGCDTVNLLRTSKQKADDMKRQIVQKISSMLVDITGDSKATMKYVDYEEQIVQKYGIELQGWTFDKFACPSSLSTSLPGLRNLLRAVNNGDCRFVKLSPLEVKARHEEREKQIEEGTVAVKTRKRRKDIGSSKKSRTSSKGKKRAADTDSDDDGDGSDKQSRPK